MSFVKTFLRGIAGMARIINGTKMNLIGANVEKRRKELKMSQREFSEKLELYAVYICRGSVSRIEDYSRTVTDIELYAISKVLHMPIEELIIPDFFNFE